MGADSHYVWIEERNAKRNLAHKTGWGFASRVVTGNGSFIGCFMHQGAIGIGIASDIYRQIAYLHRGRIENRCTAFVERKARSLQAQSVDVGTAAQRCKQ